MELFKAAQRIPPRRIPVVRRYDALPPAPGFLPPVSLPKGKTPAYIAGGVIVLALAAYGIGQLMDSEPAPTPHPTGGGSASAAAPKPTASFRVFHSDGGGGGGGGGGQASVGPLIHEKASAGVVTQLRKIIFTLKKDPSTHANMTDRISLFGKYFNSLTPSDRIALFGTIDFRQLEGAIRKQADKGPQALDRCMSQLQLVLF